METSFLTWLLFTPLLLSLATFAARWLGRYMRLVAETIHLVSVTLVFVLALIVIGQVMVSGEVMAINNWLHVDMLGAIFLLIVGLVGFLAGIYSIGYIRHDLQIGEFDDRRLTTYYGLFSFFTFTMLLAVTSNNIIMMWVAIEATTLSSAFLVGIYGNRSALEAAWKYVIICTVGVAFGLYGTILIYSDAANVLQQPAMAVFWTEIVKSAGLLDPTLLKLAFVFVLIGFGTKAGIFPMHSWLPDAHSEAPSPVSALLSAVLLNCALLIIIRFSIIVSDGIGPAFTQTLFLVFGLISIGAAAFFMFVQRDIKRLLAYSSMENLGLIMFALGLGGPVGILAALLQTLNHSLVKSLMFFLSGNILIKFRSRSLDFVKGSLQAAPLTSILLIGGTLALVGSPPFNIFISKFLIISSGIGAGYSWLIIVCLLLFMVAFVALLRMISSAVFGERPSGVVKGDVNFLILTPAVILMTLILVIGLYIPPQLSTLLNEATKIVMSAHPAILITQANLFQSSSGQPTGLIQSVIFFTSSFHAGW
jgi:hydrogenase-4 component F